ncbi:type II toxin-antitoxin system VapC family toxin [Microlunatus elymi]|uniref:Type II toxin-antitoxin system VapC family toxin n=1 Tax=Microlunatus elymi TaxID=2596828 RepID=A0A516Q4X3_9ACTN|nr:type II toxin-antitoxin system VapC family toxin [Microlunatus elymi]QDP98271.1 type II toxin-antitoxin system VapC family toxin [Microlunatus elymi]
MAAALTDRGHIGEWARGTMTGQDLVAPHFLPVEVAHTIRRMELGQKLTSAAAREAHTDLASRRIRYIGYGRHADRIWELRHNVTPYDAWYVAVAESLNLPLGTIDVRLSNASGPRCKFLTPPAR